jgi:hypothetical protein
MSYKREKRIADLIKIRGLAKSASDFIPLFEPEEDDSSKDNKKNKKPSSKKPKKSKPAEKNAPIVNEENTTSEEVSEEVLDDEKEIFDFKESEAEVVASLNNLITHVPKLQPPIVSTIQSSRSLVNEYSSSVISKLKNISGYIEENIQISNNIVNSIDSGRYYVVNNFNSLSGFFSGSFQSLENNKIDPSKHPSEVVQILGVKVNDFLVFRKNFIAVAKAFVSGVNNIAKYKNNLNSSNILKLYINVKILLALYRIISNSTSSYSDILSKVAPPRKKQIKKEREPGFGSDKSLESSDNPIRESSISIVSINPSSGIRTENGQDFFVDYRLYEAGSTDFYIDIILDKEYTSKERLEKELMEGGIIYYGFPNMSPEGKPDGFEMDIQKSLMNYTDLMLAQYIATRLEGRTLRVAYSASFLSLLSNIKKGKEYEPYPIIRIRDNNNSYISVNAEMKNNIKKYSESVTQTKYKVSVNGKKTTMSVAEIYMAKQSGKKVKVLGMQSLSDEVSKWSPRGKKK